MATRKKPGKRADTNTEHISELNHDSSNFDDLEPCDVAEIATREAVKAFEKYAKEID